MEVYPDDTVDLDDDLVKKVGVDGSHEDDVVMGCAGWVGSQIRQHGAC